MTRYCFDIEPVANIRDLCGRMAGKPLQSPYRSTVPLMSLVEHSRPQWESLLASVGAPPDTTVYFEYRVASPKPGGKPSQTDALVMSESRVWAIEAKWTEPRYENVSSRASKPEADGADPKKTVGGWLKYLQPFAKPDLQGDQFLDVVYQVLHRAASACAVASAKGLQPELVYLHFHPSPLKSSATTAQYADDLRRLKSLLGPSSGLKMTVMEVPLQPTAAFEAIQTLDKSDPATAAKVSSAICAGPLFNFGKPVITAI